MSRFLNERFRCLEEYVPGEQPRDAVYTKLNTNESPYHPGPKTLAAVRNLEIIKKLRLYSDPDSVTLCDALAAKYEVERRNIFVSNGSDDILNFVFMAFCDGGVLFPEISYGFYEVFASLHRVEYEKVPLHEDFTITPEDYMNKGKTVVIANPNAPTGLALSPAEIEEITKTNSESVVIIDEAYIDFGAHSVTGLTAKYDNLLVVQTYSKSRSLAGARLGYAIGNEKLISDLVKIKYSTNPYNVNTITSAAGVAALSEDDYYMDNCRKIMDTRAWTVRALTDLGFRVIPSATNFIFVAADVIDGQELYKELKKRKILIRHFDNPAIRQYNRITIGTRNDMKLLIAEIEEIIGGQ